MADSALDCPIYDGLASPDELRAIIRLFEGDASDASSAVSRLRIGAKLGRGSEGDVYKATFDGQRVALKVMKRRDRRAAKDWRKVVAEYLAEAKLLRLCEEQTTILGLHGAVEFPSSLLTELEGASRPSLLPGFGLILDLSQRGTLRDLVEQQMHEPGTPLYSDADALGWCIDIAAAVQFLHSLKPIIIHRDIKLENVLLFDGLERPSAKLCDFGLAAIGYEAIPRASLRRLNSQNSRNASRNASRQSSRNASRQVSRSNSRQGSRPTSRQASMTSMHRVDDTASNANTNNTNTVAGARIAAAAERAVAAAAREEMLRQAAPSTPPPSSNPQLELSPTRLTALRQANGAGKDASSLPRRVSIAGDLEHKDDNYRGDGPNPRVLTQHLQQVQDNAALNSPTAGSGGGGTRTIGGRSAEPGRALGGISTRRRLSVRQTVAFALPETEEKTGKGGDSTNGGGQGGPDGAADLPNLVADDEESFNARRRLSRVSSAGSFTSRASSVSVTGRTGSLAYLAPEVDCRKTYNESADVFSFAVLMYQLFARKSLVLECRDTEGALERLQMRMTEGYRPERPKGCHVDVWEVIEACWQPVSTDRPLMDEVMQQLDAVVVDLRTSIQLAAESSANSNKKANSFQRAPSSSRTSQAATAAAAGDPLAKAPSGGAGDGSGRSNAVHPMPVAAKHLGVEEKEAAPPAPVGCGCVIC